MEIERKYLVNREKWEEVGKPEKIWNIRQGYLSINPECSVRIRIANDQAFLTVKGKTIGISREEFEYPVPVEDGLEMLKLSWTPVIRKCRFDETIDGKKWEVDVFSGENEGLIIAEVELDHPDEIPVLPVWIDKEVSGDRRYFNLQLAINPISAW